ncbi:MAG: beta-ketoacyl-[acyl-carrier-protein] synthase family protein [Gammaproteobacteria bacterium]
MPRRVVVTGIGILCSLGNDYVTVSAAAFEGRSGIRPVPGWAELGLKCLVAGSVAGVEEKLAAAGLPARLRNTLSGASLYCVLAAVDAARDSGLSRELLEARSTGCIVGSGVGCVETIHAQSTRIYAGETGKVSSTAVLRAMSSSPSAMVATALQPGGRCYSISSACATGAHCIGHGLELIRAGLLERAIVGSGEALSPLVAGSFQALRFALSARHNETPSATPRPFAADRDGFILGEGAAVLVLEERAAALARGAHIHAEIVGYAANGDASDFVLPDQDGESAADCMNAAIADAGLQAADVDAINAHGTATVLGDRAEAVAIRRSFTGHIPPISSTKAMTGHALGGAGAIEAVLSIAMLEHGYVPVSRNCEPVAPEFADLPIVRQSVRQALDVVLSNSFGFGGTNASLVFQRADAPDRGAPVQS